MTNTTAGVMTSTTSNLSEQQIQTPENTVAPFESILDGGDGVLVEPAAPAKRKWVRPPRTKAYREAKAAERARLGIAKPGPKSKAELAAEITVVPTVAPAPRSSSGKGDQVLKALVEALVALENNDQYRGVWVHFFAHGGVYNGPRYLDQLTAAIAYLQSAGK